MSDQTTHSTPTDEALEDLSEALEQEESAVEEVAEEVAEQVAEEVATAAETVQEAATEAAEAIEDAVEEATEGHADLTPERHGDEVYDRVMQRLREDGVLPSGAVAEEVSGDSEPVGTAIEEPPPVESREVIAPRREHWWYQPRRIFGRGRN